MNKTLFVIMIMVVVVALLCPFSLADEAPVCLVLSHPSHYYLSDLLYLVRSHKITVPRLQIIGVYHADQQELYTGARRLVAANKIDWVRFVTLKGKVPAKALFTTNIWTATFRRLFAISDGIIFPGGPDLPPHIYGAKTNLLTVIRTPQRHYYELSWLFHLLGSSRNPKFVPLLAARPQYLVWGICLGMQTMNVATGGSLHQDIPSQIYHLQHAEQVLALPPAQRHKNYNYFLTADPRIDSGVLHPLALVADDPVAQHFRVESAPLVISIHHQCIKELGMGLKVWATSADGRVIEAVYHQRFPNVLGTQFHPERQRLWEKEGALRESRDSSITIAEKFHRHRPSVLFHQKLWQTFNQQLLHSRQTRPQASSPAVSK